MIPKKKRQMMIIISVIVFLVIFTIIMTLLYITTDMFKSNSTLFTKYIGQNVEKIATMYDEAGTSEYEELLKQSKYTTQTQVKVNFTENIGTSSESTQNPINQLKLQINGQTDSNNQYNYQNIQLLGNEDEQVSRVEYIQRGNTYGIRFSELFNQYILADNENLKELFKKIGYTEEEIANIPDSIELNYDWKSIFQFSEEEKENIKAKYINIISRDISDNNFSKQSNQEIQVNEKNINTNSYALTLTKEQLNNIYINLLEEIKQDEIILTKIDNIQALLEQYKLNETTNLKEQFTQDIENLITNITKNNIGQEEIKIIVYENNRETVRTMIQHPDYEVCIDILSSQAEEYLQIDYQDTTLKKEITYNKKENGEMSVTLKNTEDENTAQYSFNVNEKVEGNHCIKNIKTKYEDSTNRLEATIEQTIDKVENLENEVVLNDENAINLSKLETEQVQRLLNQVNSGISAKANEITAVINTEDIWNILKTVGLAKEEQILEETGITESEKNRFNSQFEILQGDELEADSVLNLIEAIKENLIDLEVVSNTELKLKLDRLNKNEEVATTLSAFIEQNKNKKYNAKVEYDETTGLVSDILLTMLEE